MNIDFAVIFGNIFGSLAIWIAQHGVRVFLIIFAAIVVGALAKTALSRKKIMPALDNIARSSYKGVLGRISPRESSMGEAQKQRIATILKAANNTLLALVWMIAIIMLLPEFGINIAPILASLGLVGLAVGMAAKDILTDFIAGIFIIFEGGYNIGDDVEIAGFFGKVLEISLRRTMLQNAEGVVCAIPNREVKLIKRFAGRKKEVEKENKVKITTKEKK